MRVQVAVVFVCGLLVTAPATPVHAGSIPDTVVPFVAHRPGEIVVAVMVGAEGPFRFLLDTGSSHTAVSPRVADAVGARPTARTEMATSVGSVECLVVQLSDVTIGAARADSLAATILPPAAAQVLGDHVDGIVGQDFLSRFDYTIDYRRSRLVWNDDVEHESGRRLTLVPSQGRFVVELPQDRRDGWLARFVPDSGADVVVLFENASLARLAPANRSNEWRRMASLAGNGLVRPALLQALLVGGVELRDEAAVVVKSRANADAEDGLLPLHLFGSVSFSHRHGYMLVRPR